MGFLVLCWLGTRPRSEWHLSKRMNARKSAWLKRTRTLFITSSLLPKKRYMHAHYIMFQKNESGPGKQLRTHTTGGARYRNSRSWFTTRGSHCCTPCGRCTSESLLDQYPESWKTKAPDSWQDTQPRCTRSRGAHPSFSCY